MKILFLGGVLNPDELDYLEAHTSNGLQYAAHLQQINIINGFNSIDDIDIDYLSIPFIEPFPNKSDLLFYKGCCCYFNKIEICTCSFINVWGYRNLSRARSLKRKLRGIEVSSYTHVFIYSTHTPLLEAAKYIKSKNSQVKITMMVPDLPQYTNLSIKKSPIYSFFKSFDLRRFERLNSLVDQYVLLTKHMSKVINKKDKPYIVIEGMVPKEKFYNNSLKPSFEKSEKKVIVYTGSTHKRFGILDFVKEFLASSLKNIELVICGIGDSTEELVSLSKSYDNLKYLGFVTHKKAIEIQNAADLLVNPRISNEVFTNFSFPSKNLEYMLVSKPIVCFKLGGIPDEYDDFLIYPDNETYTALLEKCIQVISMPFDEREMLGKSIYCFASKKKNNFKQVSEIVDFMRYRG